MVSLNLVEIVSWDKLYFFQIQSYLHHLINIIDWMMTVPKASFYKSERLLVD